jgi:hypothetical protein
MFSVTSTPLSSLTALKHNIIGTTRMWQAITDLQVCCSVRSSGKGHWVWFRFLEGTNVYRRTVSQRERTEHLLLLYYQNAGRLDLFWISLLVDHFLLGLLMFLLRQSLQYIVPLGSQLSFFISIRAFYWFSHFSIFFTLLTISYCFLPVSLSVWSLNLGPLSSNWPEESHLLCL